LLTVANAQKLTGSTYNAANAVVAQLCSLGILQEATGYKRNRVFRYAPYIAIFGDDAPNEIEETKGATA
jgi:hypothetical protein